MEASHGRYYFSNEKVPGEGEHKIVHYLREHKKIGESCCIHGMDADLIMLGLASPCDDIYILRDDSFNYRITHVVNLGEIRKKLGNNDDAADLSAMFNKLTGLENADIEISFFFNENEIVG